MAPAYGVSRGWVARYRAEGEAVMLAAVQAEQVGPRRLRQQAICWRDSGHLERAVGTAGGQEAFDAPGSLGDGWSGANACPTSR